MRPLHPEDLFRQLVDFGMSVKAFSLCHVGLKPNVNSTPILISRMEALAFEGQQSLSDRFFNLEGVSDKFLKFSENTEKAFYQRLPFPIAVVYRKIANAANNTQRYSLLIELFEVVIRFIVLVNRADYLNSRKAVETLVQQVPDMLWNSGGVGRRLCEPAPQQRKDNEKEQKRIAHSNPWTIFERIGV